MTALASGVLLGLFCGLAPGPLLALVLTQTLRHGAREGCKIALTPLVTDAPIIALALALAAKMAHLRPLLGIVSITGGAFVLYLAWDGFRPVRVAAEATAEHPKSWFKGILTNLLNPHPWLFWMTVGAATLAKVMAQSWVAAVAFQCGFYLLLVGSKVVVVLLAARSRDFLAGLAISCGDARPSRAAGLLCAPAVPGGVEAARMISPQFIQPSPARPVGQRVAHHLHIIGHENQRSVRKGLQIHHDLFAHGDGRGMGRMPLAPDAVGTDVEELHARNAGTRRRGQGAGQE